MNEQWLVWDPVQSAIGPYLMTKIFYDTPGLTILLEQQDTDKKIQILFEGCVESYKFTDVKNRSIKKSEGPENSSQNIKFFKVLNSHYLKQLSIQSCTISDTRNLTHFVIITLDGVIEVAYSSDPLITELGQPL